MAQSVVLRQRAIEDVDDIVEYLATEAGPDVASRLIDAFEEAVAELCSHPEIGSLRYSYELELPGLRCWGIRSFPYAIFYVAGDSVIDVWRVLDRGRDLPAWLETPPPDTA